MDDIAIKIDRVSKNFHLPDEKLSSVKSHLVHPLKKRKFKSQRALKNITVDIQKGEFFGIVGRNGSGKSTLLKIIAGIYQPTKGAVSVSGKLVPFIELGVGFNPELSGRDNVYLNGALLGFSNKEIDAMYDDIVEFAELKKFMDQKLKNYSSGMQVRLAFSMAVRARADILLIDEVLAVGDADFQRKCFNYFNQLKNAHKTVVFVSHDMDAVQKYCDRAMLIENSEIMDIGDTYKIAQQYIRLFNEENKQLAEQAGSSDKRWGNGRAMVKDITVKVDDDNVTIKETIQVNQDLDKPMLGFRIRSSSGQPIVGTNNQFERVTIPDMKAGQIMHVEWQVPNIFSDNKYYVDPSIVHSDGTTVADWWDEAVTFTIRKNRPLPYPVDLKIKLKVS